MGATMDVLKKHYAKMTAVGLVQAFVENEGDALPKLPISA